MMRHAADAADAADVDMLILRAMAMMMLRFHYLFCRCD